MVTIAFHRSLSHTLENYFKPGSENKFLILSKSLTITHYRDHCMRGMLNRTFLSVSQCYNQKIYNVHDSCILILLSKRKTTFPLPLSNFTTSSVHFTWHTPMKALKDLSKKCWQVRSKTPVFI